MTRLCLFLALLLAVTPGYAGTTCTATASGNFNDAAVWSPSIPGDGDTAIINGSVTLTITSATTPASGTLAAISGTASGATLAVPSTGSFAISASQIINGGRTTYLVTQSGGTATVNGQFSGQGVWRTTGGSTSVNPLGGQPVVSCSGASAVYCYRIDAASATLNGGVLDANTAYPAVYVGNSASVLSVTGTSRKTGASGSALYSVAGGTLTLSSSGTLDATATGTLVYVATPGRALLNALPTSTGGAQPYMVSPVFSVASGTLAIAATTTLSAGQAVLGYQTGGTLDLTALALTNSGQFGIMQSGGTCNGSGGVMTLATSGQGTLLAISSGTLPQVIPPTIPTAGNVATQQGNFGYAAALTPTLSVAASDLRTGVTVAGTAGTMNEGFTHGGIKSGGALALAPWYLIIGGQAFAAIVAALIGGWFSYRIIRYLMARNDPTKRKTPGLEVDPLSFAVPDSEPVEKVLGVQT